MSGEQHQAGQRSPREALAAAIEIAEGQSAFARLLTRLLPPGASEIRQGHVSNWLEAGKLPDKYAVIAEQALGGRVTRDEFAPNLYRRPVPDGASS